MVIADYVKFATNLVTPSIFRVQFHTIGFQEKTLHRRLLAMDQGHDDFTVTGVLPRFADDHITVQDTGITHAATLNTQKIMWLV